MSMVSWMRLWYRKPQLRDLDDYIRELNDERRIPEDGQPQKGARKTSLSIPSRLSLERVLANKTCSPMSLHDFYMYLRYIEHSSENLEFYLWYKQYDSNYPDDLREKVDINVDIDLRAERPFSDTISVSSVVEIIKPKQNDSSSSMSETLSTLETPCARAARLDASWASIFRWSMGSNRPRESVNSCAHNGCRLDLNDDDVERKSALPLPLFAKFTTNRQENRAELDAAIATYLNPGAEKELNISHLLRQRTIMRLKESSDPKHLKPVADHIYEVMRNCSHRNFVSMGVSTGTYETICMGNLIGILDLIAGVLLVLMRGFYPHIGSHNRWNAFYSFPLWAMGTTLILVGTQGMCFIMLSLSKRQALPWERFDDDASVVTKESAPLTGLKGWFKRYRVFMNRTVAHDRTYKVEDKQLRRLQRMILTQCIVYGCIVASCLVLVFIFLPIWKDTI